MASRIALEPTSMAHKVGISDQLSKISPVSGRVFSKGRIKTFGFSEAFEPTPKGPYFISLFSFSKVSNVKSLAFSRVNGETPFLPNVNRCFTRLKQPGPTLGTTKRRWIWLKA
jgi:hypothetical protein